MFKGFASLRQNLTLIVFLRRISRSLHRANELAEARLRLEFPAAYKSGVFTPGAAASRRGQPKLVDMGVAQIEDLNAAWAERHPASTDHESDNEYDIS